MIDSEQFYPTPQSLVKKMWSKFERGRYSRILEPSAGEGDMIDDLMIDRNKVHCVEIDFARAAVLRASRYKVVGNDFLQFQTPYSYDRIIMNPPFARGAEHVLHAYDLLIDGEVVALINAETIRNPCDRHRKRLAMIIAEHGDDAVEFVEAAFQTDETRRKTAVECAIIRLEKTYEPKLDYSFLADLRKGDFDGYTQDDPSASELTANKSLAVPESVVERAVTVYNAACRALKREIDITTELASVTSGYTRLLEKSILEPEEEEEAPRFNSYSPQEDYAKRLDGIKQQAWSTVLARTKIGKSLSSDVRSHLEKEFEGVSALEFTVPNILGFLSGLARGHGDMQIQMLADVHRLLLCYHHGNQIYYKGWKSNNKHRIAFQIKPKRIILPLYRSYGFLERKELDRFNDIDRAFHVLAGKEQSDVMEDNYIGLADAIVNNLKSGSKRIDAGYFEIRLYSRSIHLFPKDPELVRRLNLLVGQHYQWIPPEVSDEDYDFWNQYQKAESYQDDLSEAMEKTRVWDIVVDKWDENVFRKNAFEQAIVDAGEKRGFNMNFGSQLKQEASGGALCSNQTM